TLRKALAFSMPTNSTRPQLRYGAAAAHVATGKLHALSAAPRLFVASWRQTLRKALAFSMPTNSTRPQLRYGAAAAHVATGKL
ncbi:hypothetical protein CJ738_35550, partial [Klebsiella pneumoniae]